MAVATLITLVLTFVAVFASGCSATPPATVLSEQTLAEQYGLRINLLTLTAANGLVDLRLQVIDAEKAALLLSDAANAPALVNQAGVRLPVAEEIGSLKDLLKNDAILYFMYANAGNALTVGAPVTVKFGEIQLEPVAVR